MDRNRLLVFTVSLCSFLAINFVIAAIATNEWMVVKVPEITISFGLWKMCIENMCLNSVATVPAALAIITIILILTSLIVTIVINTQKRLSPEILCIPIIFFFISVIMLLTTIAIIWPEIIQSTLQTTMKKITDQSLLNELITNAGKSYGSNSQIHPSVVLNDLNKLNIIGSGLNGLNFGNLDLDITKLIKFKHGFSSALLITALPLLIICLITSTFIAGFRKAECITNNNRADIAYANKH